MQAIPGDNRTTVHDVATIVTCPCGGALRTLPPGEGVYPDGSVARALGESRIEEVTCGGCGKRTRLTITRYRR